MTFSLCLFQKQKSSKSSGAFELNSSDEDAGDSDDDSSDSEVDSGDDADDGPNNEPDSDDDDRPSGITHEEDRNKKKRMKKNQQQSKEKKSKSSAKAARSPAKGTKKDKIRHPIDGGMVNDGVASNVAPSPYAAMPSLEQAFAMNMQLMQQQQQHGLLPSGAGVPVPGGMIPLSGMDFAQMLQFFGSAGGMVMPDGRVQQQQQSNYVMPALPLQPTMAAMPAATVPFMTPVNSLTAAAAAANNPFLVQPSIVPVPTNANISVPHPAAIPASGDSSYAIPSAPSLSLPIIPSTSAQSLPALAPSTHPSPSSSNDISLSSVPSQAAMSTSAALSSPHS